MSRSLLIALALGATLLGAALLGPLLVSDPGAPAASGLVLTPPSSVHWLGTDPFGRDVLARVIHGARVSLIVALGATVLALVIGIPIGVLAGGTNSLVSRLTSHGINLALAVPRVIILLVLVTATGRLGPWALALLLGLTGWPAIARLARGEAQRIAHSGYALAATALGATPVRRLLREILPGTVAPALVAATLGVADVLLLEAGLSFLGIGIRPPTPSWGGMILEAQPYLADAPWLLMAPAAALVVATVTATLLGDGLQSKLLDTNR